jgi:N6-L-threonylcarbamoyladenine synthase
VGVVAASLGAWRAAPERDGPPILAIESSCDETAAAVLFGTRHLVSSVVNTQIDIHAVYGGVVPELASRAHIAAIAPVVEQALRDAGITSSQLAGVVATRGPGLLGSLLVGLEFAKGLALAHQIPLLGVHHLEGHLMAPQLAVAPGFDAPEWPCVALIVSGGHTSLYYAPAPGVYEELGRTLDDAAGEAFDKLSKMVGLGYPGGQIIDVLAEQGDRTRFALPRPMLKQPGTSFSFSGLKTAAATVLEKLREPTHGDIADLAASFREAVADILAHKTMKAARQRRVECVVVSGGVASNSRLRSILREQTQAASMRLSIPPASLCTDNAAMIGAAGYARIWPLLGSGFAQHRDDAVASWPLVDVVAIGARS